MAASDQIPIFRLNDDVLIEIFALIVHIPTKLALEPVCKRFYRLSNEPSSWRYNNKIEIIIKCDGQDHEHISNSMVDCSPYVCSCDRFLCECQRYSLNNFNIPTHHWPKAIESILKHSLSVKYLCIHIGEEIWLATNPWLDEVLQLMHKYANKMKLKSLEIFSWLMHMPGDQATIQKFMIMCIENSNNSLKHLVYQEKLQDETWNAELFQTLASCQQLESLCFTPFCDLKLLNKTLRKLEIINRNTGPFSSSHVPLTLCETGVKLEDLTLRNFDIVVRWFTMDLNLHTRNSLKRLSLHYVQMDPFLKFLPSLTAFFPNLAILNVYGQRWMELIDPGVLEESISGYFASTAQDQIQRHVSIDHFCYIDEANCKELLELIGVIESLDVQFGNIGQHWAVMSKRKATLTLNSVVQAD